MTYNSKSIEELVEELNAQNPRYSRLPGNPVVLPGNPVVLPGNPVVLPGIPIELPGIPVDPRDKWDINDTFKAFQKKYGIAVDSFNVASSDDSSKKLLKEGKEEEMGKIIDRDKDGIEWDGKYAVLRQKEMSKADACRTFGLDVYNFNLLNSTLASTNTIPMNKKINVLISVPGESENELLTLLAYSEGFYNYAGSIESQMEDKWAVCTVIKNRINFHGDIYGTSIKAVIEKEDFFKGKRVKQFQAVNNGKWNSAKSRNFKRISEIAEWNISAFAAIKVMSNNFIDSIGKAVVFNDIRKAEEYSIVKNKRELTKNEKLEESKRIAKKQVGPKWKLELITVIQNAHYYYELIEKTEEEKKADNRKKGKKN